MAGQLSKENLGSVLMLAMHANNNIRPQLGRLLNLKPRFKELSPCDDAAAGIQDLASDLFKVYFTGIEIGARYLSACLDRAIENGARIAFNTALGVIPDEQQYNVLLKQPLSWRPTTQTEAFSLVQAAFNAFTLAQRHHVSRCIQLLTGERPPNVAGSGKVPRVNYFGYPDDPVAAAADHIAKNGLPKEVKATPAAVATRKKAPQAASRIDVDQALTNLHRASSLVGLAVCHIDIAIGAISTFLDPKEVARLSELTDRVGYINEDGERCIYPTESGSLARIEAVKR